MPVCNEFEYPLPVAEIVNWLRRQPPDTWWNVDGDSVLASRLDFPCPWDELADELERINRPLVLNTHKPNPHGRPVSAENLDSFVERTHRSEDGYHDSDRLLYLRWRDSREEWALVEELPPGGGG